MEVAGAVEVENVRVYWRLRGCGGWVSAGLLPCPKDDRHYVRISVG